MIIFHLFSIYAVTIFSGTISAGLSVVRLVATPRHAVALCEGGQLLEEAVVGPGSLGDPLGIQGIQGIFGEPQNLEKRKASMYIYMIYIYIYVIYIYIYIYIYLYIYIIVYISNIFRSVNQHITQQTMEVSD
jgi:hypothetical protein